MSQLIELLSLTRPLLIFDTETTGQNPSTDRIVELGFIQIKPDGTVKEWQSYINPGVPIPREASHGNGAEYSGHGITDSIVQGCRACGSGREENEQHLAACPDDCGAHDFLPWPTFKQIAANLLIGFSNTDFAGYSIRRYDLPLMVAEFSRAGIVWGYDDAKTIDGHRMWQLTEGRNLSAASERFLRRKHEGAHRALTDVTTTRDVIIAQLLEFPTLLPRDVAALHEKQWPMDPNSLDPDNTIVWKDGVATFARGKKWKDVPLHKMTRRDLSWIATEATGFSPAVKKICADAANGKFPEPPTR